MAMKFFVSLKIGRRSAEMITFRGLTPLVA
jgi:hypothetical protein